MPKAAKKSITQKLSVNGKGRRTADADFFAKIARRAAEWRKDLAKKTASDTVSGACQIEFEVAASKVLTKSGFHAKCRAVAQDGWDADDMVVIAFLLGRDAERLGIAGVPSFLRDRDGEVWPGKMTERVELFAEVYAEGSPA